MEWNRVRAIGTGSSATVWIATDRSSGEVFAVKSAELSKSECLQREQKILSSLNSPRIIAYKGFDTSSEGNGELAYNLFMEFAPGGSLSDEIRRRGGSLSDDAARTCARDILLGLRYLHAQGIAHCDVKARNVLVTGEGLKIADFGCARLVAHRHVAGSDRVLGGTPAYMAPEVARGEEQGFAADVWAFGCTVIEMLTGGAPWVDGLDLDPVSLLYRIGFSGDKPEIPGYISEEGRDFLGKCLRRDPAERWSASELLEHPFLDGEGMELEAIGGSGSELDSPRSVLECNNAFMRLGETSGPGCRSGSECPGERIGRLSGVNAKSFCGIDNWASEEGWLTVRENWAQVRTNELCFGLESDRVSDNEPIDGKRIDVIGIDCGDDLACVSNLIFCLRNCKHRKSCMAVFSIGVEIGKEVYSCPLNVPRVTYCEIVRILRTKNCGFFYSYSVLPFFWLLMNVLTYISSAAEVVTKLLIELITIIQH